MQKAEKERVIEELTERLRSADALLVADYRGLTNSQLAGLRSRAPEARGQADRGEEHPHPAGS